MPERVLAIEPAMSDTTLSRLRLALAQLNPTVGDLAGNVAKLKAARERARAEGADLIVFPELFVTGYPPEDLVLKPAFQKAARTAVEKLAAELGPGPAVLTGTIWPEAGKIYNAVALLDQGAVQAVRFKVDLPNYGVFDEKRVFDAGPLPGPISFKGVRLGVPICEDIWKDEVTECLAETGAEILIVPNGSPFDWKKPDARLNVAVARVAETGLPLAYVNQVGGQDELVFDGASFVLNADRSLAAQLPAWEEAVTVTDWVRGETGWRCERGPVANVDDGDGAAYHACVLGVRDYVEKNGFPAVLLGLSGGVDFGARRGDRRRCAGRQARARGHDAVPLHVERERRRCNRMRASARHPARHGADRRAGRSLRNSRSPSCSKAARQTRRRRTFRAVRAASS